jgi:hypothetical protein
MNKLELQQQADLLINPINVVTEFGFKLGHVEYKSEWDLDDDSSYESLKFGFNTNIKSHYIGLYIQPNNSVIKYQIWYNRHDGGKVYNVTFQTELELCVFLKQSKFKIK